MTSRPRLESLSLRRSSPHFVGFNAAILKRLACVLMCFVLAGCTGVDILNGLSPTGGVVVSPKLAYAAGDRHGVDVYAPAGAMHAPVVVFFYGGSWQEGNKADYAFVALALARRGIVVAVPDYRVFPAGRFAEYMQDGAAAVRWTRQHAADFGGDPDRLVLMGHSAGAQIAALLTLNPKWLAAEGLDPHRDIAGMVGLAGPYDFLPLKDPILKTIFGPPATLANTQPITFVDGRNPPMLLVTDDEDVVVEPRNTYNLAARIKERGGPVETRTYSHLSHRLLIGVVSVPLGFLAPVLDDVTGFVLGLARAGGGAQR